MDPITIIVLIVIVLLIVLAYKFAEWKDKIEGVGSPPPRNNDQNFAPYQPPTPTEEPQYIDIEYQIRINYQKMLQSNTEQVMRMKDADYAVLKNHVFSVLKTQIEKPEEYLVDLYFHFQSLQDTLYKWRSEREDVIELCREICNENLNIVQNRQFGVSGMSSPSITRLCVIEERMGNYQRVVEICDICQKHGIIDSSSQDHFQSRRARMMQKCASSNNKHLHQIPDNIKKLLYIDAQKADEPSAINTSLPISDIDDGSFILGYPDYSKLSPFQRYKYITAMSNILDGTQDMGYVFLYYYGLERQILEGDFDAAFDMIVSLRDVYDNKSFQKYSADALILTCLKKQKYEHLSSFLNSIDKPHELELDVDSYLFAKAVCGIGFDTMDIFKFRKAFAYTSTTYIKENKEQFLEYLEQSIVELVGDSAIDTSCLLEHAEDCGYTVVCPYANMSLHHVHAQVPCLHEQSPFYEYCGKALMLAHERVKEYRKEMRKELSASNNAKY